MPNAQQYLNKNYPTKEKESIKELDINNKDLEGELIIQDFPNLESIKCGNNKSLKTIELGNLPKLNYFHANNCQLTKLVITNCLEIDYFNVGNNLLTDTSFFTNLNPEKLNHLSIHSNNFVEQNLSFLSRFTNLEKLFIGNTDKENFSQDFCNRWTGSLEPLKDFKELKWVSIGNTNIDSGLEYLPENLKKINCRNELKITGCSKIREEIERSAKLPKVSEKLQKEEENEPSFVKDWYRIAPWRQARDLLGEEEFKKQIIQQDAQKWLDENRPPHTNRQHYKELVVNNKNIVGELDLSDFIVLEKLDCSDNQLISLNLSKCNNLTELDCSGNAFINTGFLQTIPNPEKLEKLKLNNNEKLRENLDFLSPFTGLIELNISNCSFFGSLKPLESMKSLKLVDISDTDINSGIEHLSDSCWELYCNPNTKKKSIKVVGVLTKHLEERKYYNLVKWREEWRNNIILSIPTERLFVIRSNIKKFINKWGKEVGNNLYEQFLIKLGKKKERNNASELNSLQSPEEFSMYWYTGGIKWIARAGATTGGILALNGYPTLGGALAAAFPFVETASSRIEEKLYNVKEKKWEEFIQDSEELLDNYHELLGILEPLKGYKLGKVNQALANLNNKANKFLDTYDKPSENGEERNGVVDISELTDLTSRKNLAEDLNKEKLEGEKSQLGEIVQAIIQLEKEISNYRRGFYYGTSEVGIEEEWQHEVRQRAIENPIEFIQNNSHNRLLNIELETRIEIPTNKK